MILIEWFRYWIVPTVTPLKPKEPNYGRFIDHLKNYAHGIKVSTVYITSYIQHIFAPAITYSNIAGCRVRSGWIDNFHQVVCLRWTRSRRLFLGRQEPESQSSRLHHTISGGLCRRVSLCMCECRIERVSVCVSYSQCNIFSVDMSHWSNVMRTFCSAYFFDYIIYIATPSLLFVENPQKLPNLMQRRDTRNNPSLYIYFYSFRFLCVIRMKSTNLI